LLIGSDIAEQAVVGKEAEPSECAAVAVKTAEI
jgi:hypothetical protein